MAVRQGDRFGRQMVQGGLLGEYDHRTPGDTGPLVRERGAQRGERPGGALVAERERGGRTGAGTAERERGGCAGPDVGRVEGLDQYVRGLVRSESLGEQAGGQLLVGVPDPFGQQVLAQRQAVRADEVGDEDPEVGVEGEFGAAVGVPRQHPGETRGGGHRSVLGDDVRGDVVGQVGDRAQVVLGDLLDVDLDVERLLDLQDQLDGAGRGEAEVVEEAGVLGDLERVPLEDARDQLAEAVQDPDAQLGVGGLDHLVGHG